MKSAKIGGMFNVDTHNIINTVPSNEKPGTIMNVVKDGTLTL